MERRQQEQSINVRSSKLRYAYGEAKILFPSTGRWGAWVTEPKSDGGTKPGSWIFLGAHLTRRLAVRCQDRALLKLHADSNMSLPIQLSFPKQDYQEDDQMRKSLSHEEFFDQLRGRPLLITKTCLQQHVWASSWQKRKLLET